MYRISEKATAREEMLAAFPEIHFERLLEDGACRIMTAASGLLHADITVFSHWLETKGMRDDESMDDFIVRKYGADALRVVNNLFL